MKRLCMFWALGFAICLSILYLNSCNDDRKYPVESEVPEADYHLFYGHAGGVGWIYTAVYSTKTGEMVDSIPLDSLIYDDFCFTSNGRYVVNVGFNWNGDHHTGILWIVDMEAGELLNIVETKKAREIHLSHDDAYIMIPTPSVLMIYSFPDLALAYIDSADFVDAGFLPGNSRAYYMLENKDSLFVVDFGDPDTTVLNAYYIEHSERPLQPYQATVDYQSNNLILVARQDEFFRSYIQVFNADGFEKKQSLKVAAYYFYSGITCRPYSTQVILYFNGGLSSESIFRLYDVETNTLRVFLTAEEFYMETPFMPEQVVFTPDGEKMYILIGGGLWGHTAVLGIKMSDKSIIGYFLPPEPAGITIEINPINHALNRVD